MRPRQLALLTALLLAGSALPAAGQNVNIRGRIIAADTKAPLPGAYIQAAFPRWSAFTDKDGNFVLKDVPRDALRFTAGQIGYADISFEISPADTAGLEIEMTPNPVALLALNISVNRMTRRRRMVPTTVRLLDRAAIMSAPGNALDIVRARGGMYITPCPSGTSTRNCTFRRGRVVNPAVYIDERRAFGGLDELEQYSPNELYAIETYGGSMVRAYTIGFMDRITRNGRPLDPILIFDVLW